MAYASAAITRALTMVPGGRSKRRVRTCGKCGEAKLDRDGRKWCAVCRVASALQLKLWRHKQHREGLCCDCVAKGHYSRSLGRKLWRCTEHNDYTNAWQRAKIERRRAAGECARCGGRSLDAYHCDSCREKINATRKARQAGRSTKTPFRYAA